MQHRQIILHCPDHWHRMLVKPAITSRRKGLSFLRATVTPAHAIWQKRAETARTHSVQVCVESEDTLTRSVDFTHLPSPLAWKIHAHFLKTPDVDVPDNIATTIELPASTLNSGASNFPAPSETCCRGLTLNRLRSLQN